MLLYTQWYGAPPNLIRGFFINLVIFVMSFFGSWLLFGQIITAFIVAFVLSGIFVCHLTYFIEYFRMEYGQTISVLLSLLVLFVYVIMRMAGTCLYLLSFPLSLLIFFICFFSPNTFRKDEFINCVRQPRQRVESYLTFILR